MNLKRWLLASVAAFVVTWLLDMVIHGKLLMGLYEQTETIWRPQHEAGGLMGLMMLAQAAFAVLFTWMFVKGYEAGKTGLGQGLRFGVYAGLLLGVPSSLVWYVVLPIPAALAWRWGVATLVECLAAGAASGLVYRPR